jgi:hypothetical protein
MMKVVLSVLLLGLVGSEIAAAITCETYFTHTNHSLMAEDCGKDCDDDGFDGRMFKVVSVKTSRIFWNFRNGSNKWLSLCGACLKSSQQSCDLPV